MIRSILLIASLFFAFALQAQIPESLWAFKIGADQYDNGRSVAITPEGDVLIAGHFSGTADFDPGPASFNMTASGDYSAFILKVNPHGELLWAKKIVGSIQVAILRITVDPTGNIYTSGLFQGTTDFDPGTGVHNMSSVLDDGYPSMDVFVSKLDTGGNYLWAKSFGNSQGDIVKDIRNDAQGNLYVSGLFNQTIDFDPGPAEFELTATANSNNYILKLDNDGAFEWAAQFGSFYDNSGNESMDVDAAGNIYITGEYSSTGDFDPGDGSHLLEISAPNGNGNYFQDIFILKLDTDSNFVWAKKLGGSSMEVATAVKLDGNGNVYVAGYAISSLDLDPGTLETTTYNPEGTQQMFLVKLDSNGDFLWGKGFGTTGNTLPESLFLDGQGAVYAAGSFSNSIDFNGDGDMDEVSMGSEDAFIAKWNNNGLLQWSHSISGTEVQHAHSLTVDEEGGIYTTGGFSGMADFDPADSGLLLTAAGSYDIFVSKLGFPELGMAGLTKGDYIKVYPNPSSGWLTVSVPSSMPAVQIELYSILGQHLMTFAPNTTIGTSNFDSGSYLLVVKEKGRSIMKKIILK